MDSKINRVVLVIAGLMLLLVVAGLGSPGYAAPADRSSTAAAAQALLAPSAQAAQATETAVPVSSRGGGVVEALPAVGEQAPTPLPVADPSGGALPISGGNANGVPAPASGVAADPSGGALPVLGRGVDAGMYLVLGALVLVGVALIAFGLRLRISRSRDATRQ